MAIETNFQLLERFLQVPVQDGGQILQWFSQLPGAIVGEGDAPLCRYVFLPGKRKDAVVLVAHADTVWDKAYEKPSQSKLVFHDGVFSSETPDCGIGADDRAGCAMLWALRESGHSLLVVDGEEHGKRGARFLRQSNPQLFRKLNRHRFMMELDWAGTNGCLYNQVDNSNAFKEYIASRLGFQDSRQKGGCDLQVLCRDICGVNIGVGYHKHHTPNETLVLEEWETTLQALTLFLETKQSKFRIPLGKRLRARLQSLKGKLVALLRKKRK